MNETVVTYSLRDSARESRKPWNRPTLQRMDARFASEGPGKSGDANCAKGAGDPGHSGPCVS